MTQVKINDSVLRKAAEAGMDEFVQAFVDAIRNALGGELNAQNMAELNSDQITLLAWDVLHQEMMDGGMVQLIHNGYGGFIFKNPTDKAFRNWGVAGLYKLINKAHKCYNLAHEDIERDMDYDAFMALYEQYPDWEDLDDEFICMEESVTGQVATYLDNHLLDFVDIVKG